MEVSAAEQRAVLERFRSATLDGDLQGLLEILAPDVVAVADSGGFAAAIRQPVSGADRVARLLVGLARFAPDARSDTIWLNGAPAIRLHLGGDTQAVISLVVADGHVTHIYAVNNPHKLARLDRPAALAR